MKKKGGETIKLFLLMIFIFCLQAFGVDRELEAQVVDYIKILKACPNSSVVPAAVLKQLEEITDDSVKGLIASSLQKEYQIRGAALINLCRRQAYAQIKKQLDINKDTIKSTLSSLREAKELTEENTATIAAQLVKLENAFVPADITWGEDVKQGRSLIAKISATLRTFDENAELADFATLEYIAKTSVCPLLLKNKVVAANYKKLSAFPFQISAAVYQINLVRVLRRKPALLIDAKLSVVAFKHSKDMKDNNYLAHESPTEGYKTLKERAAKLKTTAAEEILGRGTRDVLKLNRVYLKRYKNARLYFGPWTRIGVGFYSKYWTQVLGK